MTLTMNAKLKQKHSHLHICMSMCKCMFNDPDDFTRTWTYNCSTPSTSVADWSISIANLKAASAFKLS